MPTRLEKSFFARDTIQVALDLLGKLLVHQLPNGGVRLSGRIVEAEAYLGVEDPACHTFGGRHTPRTSAMYSDPGTAYIYFIYGVHFCFNVVTVAPGVPEAVLIRALEPLEGIDFMLAQRPHLPLTKLSNGPGKLCSALQLGRTHNFLDLTSSSELWLEDDGALLNGAVIDGPRVGLNIVNDAAHWPLRFGLASSPFLSMPRFPSY